ncbi:MAG: glycosyltransferase family 39 protein [Paracoccaceae bacterium]
MKDGRIYALCGLYTLLLLAMVLMRPLLPIDETRYLAVAWEMRLSADPFHLTRNFEPYSHKPPLLFWLINLVWMLGGVSEIAGRLVAPAFAVLAIWGTARLARLLWPAVADRGLSAAAILCGFPVFAIYGSATMFDAMLATAVLLGAGFLWQIGKGGGRRRDWLGLGLALGLGLLTKGPVILLHLAPMLILMRFWAPVRPSRPELLRGLALSLAVALGLLALWLVPLLATADAAFREELLWTQSATRLAGGMAHDRPLWFFLALLPLLLFPFGWLPGLWRPLPAAVRTDPAQRFLLIWVLAGPVIFSFVASKQAHYLIPEFPALALMLARLGHGKWGALRRLSPVVLVLLALAVLLTLGAAGVVKVDLAGPVALGGLAAVLFLLALAVWRIGGLAGATAAGAGVALALHLFIAFTGMGRDYDSHALAAALKGGAAAMPDLAVIGQPYNAEVNFAARLTAPVATLTDADAAQAWAAAHPTGRLFGPLKSTPLTQPPSVGLIYNGKAYGVWDAASLAAP